jgi:hypothetical protein
MPTSLFPYCVPVLGAYGAPIFHFTEVKIRNIKEFHMNITDGKISSFSFLSFISEIQAQETMIQERRYAYSVRWFTLMNVVVTEIYGNRKQTDWQGKMLQWLGVLLISSLYSVLTKVMSERVVMSLTRTSRHVSHRSITSENGSSRREVTLTFQSWGLLRLQVFEGRSKCWQKANNDKVKFHWEKTNTVHSALALCADLEKCGTDKNTNKFQICGKYMK